MSAPCSGLFELMRWGGLALGDAVFFNLNTMTSNGHVKYRRRKMRGKTTRFAQPKSCHML